MESIESDIVQNDYDGLTTRDARRQFAKDCYETSKDAAEIRSLAQAALLKKEEEEAKTKQNSALPKEKTERERFIEAELEMLSQKLPLQDLKATVVDFVQVVIEVTRYTNVSLKLQFPDDYPQKAVFLDIRSSYLDTELLEKLKKAGETEAVKHLGEQQSLAVIDRIRYILSHNRLSAAFAELKQLKEYFEDKKGRLKSANEKTGDISIGLKSSRYFLDLELTVPLVYPAKAIEIRSHDSNLPSETLSLFLTAAREHSKRLAELPERIEDAGKTAAREGAGSGNDAKSERLSQSQTLSSRNRVDALASSAQKTQQKAVEERKKLEANFVSQPSLFSTVQYLFESCLSPLASGTCLICNKQLLPSDPALTSKVPKNMTTLRMYCGHTYHFKCVDGHVRSPPFGKTCLHCGAKLQHAKLLTDEKILEQRWIHQQAREREIKDVAEFMSF